MTEVDLAKFLEENSFAWRRASDGKILAWLPFYVLDDFQSLTGCGLYDDGGREVVLQQGCICIEMDSICDYFGIEPESVFMGDSSNA